jgi:hypothetical protein
MQLRIIRKYESGTMYPFLKDKQITDLGFGGGFALWGFRAIASGQSNCRCLSVGFNRAFSMDINEPQSQHGGTSGRLAMNALKSFAFQIGNRGKRKIILSEPGAMGVTADEITIVASLSAAQAGKDDLCFAHLTWLLAGVDTQYAQHAAETYGLICSRAGVEIDAPYYIDKASAENVADMRFRRA